MKNFVKFIEENDWEGETWNFYIPFKGNEEAIKKLAVRIRNSESYTLVQTPISEKEVDILVKHDNFKGYMARENKLSGKLDFTDYPNKSTNGADDPFYKGDIEKYLKVK